MKFPYIKVTDFPKHQKRERYLPWIRFGIYNTEDKSNIVYPLGLVDSGSEITIINREFGETLGLDIRKGKKVEVVGVGGGKINVYLLKIGFSIDNRDGSLITYEDLAGFADTGFPLSMPQQTAILGTVGFFQNVDIKLAWPKEILIEEKS